MSEFTETELIAAINRNTAALLTIASFIAKAANLRASGHDVKQPDKGSVLDLFGELKAKA